MVLSVTDLKMGSGGFFLLFALPFADRKGGSKWQRVSNAGREENWRREPPKMVVLDVLADSFDPFLLEAIDGGCKGVTDRKN